MSKKLVAVKKVEANLRETRSKRGRRSKAKGNEFERQVASDFGEHYTLKLVRTPQSGGFAKGCRNTDSYRGDVVMADDEWEFLLHTECKNAKTWSLPAWLLQAESDCPAGKIPIVVFHKFNSSKDYVCIGLKDFMSLVPRELIVRRKKK